MSAFADPTVAWHGSADTIRSIELLATEVLPVIRRETGVPPAGADTTAANGTAVASVLS